MDFDNGGNSSSERQRQTAAEIARKKVLAAYSSTVDTLRNLPANSKDILLNRRKQSADQQQDHPNISTGIYSSQVSPSSQNQQEYITNDANSPSSTMSTVENPAQYSNTTYETTNTLKDIPVDQNAVNAEWQKYHSAWQDYYKNYYSNYYAKAAQTYLATEKLRNERTASGETERQHRVAHLAPLFIVILIILAGLFLQYNRLIFAPIMAYISPDSGSVATSIEAIDPTITQNVSPEPRLIIPKLNIDVPVAFSIPLSEVDNAMNAGVAQFSIPGANALPGQIGNLVLSGHSAGDIYSSNPYKFIFSGLERLEDGDLIYINYDSVRYTYKMVKREVVEPTDVAALIYETSQPMLTLITCTPLGTSRYRLLITAEQISPATNPDNIASPEVPDDNPTADPAMPANEPSFFENLWSELFGN